MPHFNNDTSRIGTQIQAGTQVQPGMQKVLDSIEEMKKYSSEIRSSKYMAMTDKDWEILKTDPQNVSNTILDFLREQQKLYAKWTESFDKIADSLAAQVDTMQEQLNHTKQEAKDAKKDALFSKITSVFALLISIAAIIVPIIYG